MRWFRSNVRLFRVHLASHLISCGLHAAWWEEMDLCAHSLCSPYLASGPSLSLLQLDEDEDEKPAKVGVSAYVGWWVAGWLGVSVTLCVCVCMHVGGQAYVPACVRACVSECIRVCMPACVTVWLTCVRFMSVIKCVNRLVMCRLSG